MSLDKIIEQAGEAYRGTYSKVEAYVKEREAALVIQYEKESKLNNGASAESRIEFNELWNMKKQAIIDGLEGEIAKYEGDFFAEVERMYAPDGNDIDNDDVKLLNSGILNAKELSDMVRKHRENATMLRVIGKYIGENFKEPERDFDARVMRALMMARNAGKGERDTWKGLNSRLRTPVEYGFNHGLSEAFYNMAVKYDEVVEDAKIDLLAAKMFVDEETQEKIDSYDKAARERDAERMRQRAGGALATAGKM